MITFTRDTFHLFLTFSVCTPYTLKKKLLKVINTISSLIRMRLSNLFLFRKFNHSSFYFVDYDIKPFTGVCQIDKLFEKELIRLENRVMTNLYTCIGAILASTVLYPFFIAKIVLSINLLLDFSKFVFLYF